ncbi:trypsin-like peptidase domain-containing protein [uncultured Intestinimonas sp.]|uniref:S1C family serine protease n=1 Tax=uncultured Intestinimonas sp. TaxID=1689265 RepID=UPI0025EDC847|nr:trypsin-like peptidase domain-containing protein [uncultured Intestinimonas sp.]
MYHYYFDQSQEEAAAPPAVPSPPEPFPPAGPPSRRRKRRWSPRPECGAAAVLLLICLVLGGTAVLLLFWAQPVEVSVWTAPPGLTLPAASAPVSEAPALERYPNGDGTVLTLAAKPEGTPLSFQEIYRRVNPSIVSIRAGLSYGEAQGTGVIMTDTGYIITNAHVIEGAGQVEVSLADGRVLPAQLVGSDNPTDLAVLKVEGDGLTPAVFGDSEAMEVGDVVVAIGNPMGEQLRGTMTDGILSAINRDMVVDGESMSLLQTTAALNTGNSGGALINDQGQVIGITNMKLVSTVYDNTLEGLGFAIPTATVKPVVDALIQSGHVTGRPTLGVTVRALYDWEKEDRGVDGGVLVVSVSQGSDAQGKLQADDILLTANGTDLNTSGDLLDLRDGLAVGEAIRFRVDRAGERLEVSVALVERYDVYG